MLLLRDVRKTFREPDGQPLPILVIDDFQIGAGEQTVLMGRSGSGKTTLLHIIAGIARADAGLVQVAGSDLSKLSEAGLDRFRASTIGYVFQTFNLLSGFTALENVLLGMSFGGVAPDTGRAKQLLERVGLAARMHHRPAMLSVGEQQRVAVARALVKRPKLLLADEPTANVDAGHQQVIVDLISSVCSEENVSLLLVTHTPEVASRFTRVVNLSEINKAA